jgi:hypothetical protein
MSEQVPESMRRIRTEDSYETRWMVVGPLGAVDFHCTNMETLRRIRDSTGMRDLWRSGGVEYHHRAAPDYMKEQSHEHCWILGGPCWHDGTSLWASEHWIPLLEREGEEAIWRELHATYARHEWPATDADRGQNAGAKPQKMW